MSVFVTYISIIFVCAFIGWFTNWIAVQMVFYPINFFGIRIKKPFSLSFGWQGIIPKHSIKMSKMITNIFKNKLKASDLYKKTDPEIIIKLLNNFINTKSQKIIEIVIKNNYENIWKLLPANIKENLKKEIIQKVPKYIRRIYKKYEKNINEVFNIEQVVIHSLTGENIKHLLEVFQNAGEKEFNFIIRSGFWFGLIIGIFQVFFYELFSKWWTMPIAGVVVGYITNWLALEMIFKPLEPKKFVFFYYQGLFLKRQAEVSWKLAEILDQRIFYAENFIKLFFEGKAKEKFIEILILEIKKAYEDFITEKALLVSFIFTEKQKEKIQKDITNLILNSLPEIYESIKDHIKESVGMKDLIGKTLSFLPPKEFEHLLHSVFKEEEFLLILLGAIIGGIVGWIQAFYFLF